MRKCIKCGNKSLTHTVEEIPFNDVARVEGDVYVCDKCGARYSGYSGVEALSRRVAEAIARKEERLSPAERRFLRTYLGYSSKDFAEFLGVTPETVSRWESKTSPMEMQHATEVLLRFMALMDKPISDYGLERVGKKDATDAKPVFKQRAGEWRAA